MEQAYGAVLHEPWRAFLPVRTPKIEISHRLPGKRRDVYWLRFDSASDRIPGPAFARVSEPHGIANPPTLIFANGISMESDFDMLVPPRGAALGRGDVRIIEIESPFHGRRRKPGFYGGEPFLGTSPLGPIDLFSTEARDLAVLAGWCRETSAGPVVLAGASMGSLAATLAVSHCAHWPRAMQPDGALLLTTVDDVGRLEQASALTTGIGLTAALAAAGWTDNELARWHPLVATAASAALPPERIVMVLGRRDAVLPFSAGLDLARKWQVPPGNVFTAEGGHFSSQGAALLAREVKRRVSALLGS
jgi:pimeloyl-ACP methyl ester carboxylesterase